MEDRCLYLYGIKSNEVSDILTFGYPEINSMDESGDEFDCRLYASINLEDEIQEGISYCDVDCAVKKLSFVFAVSSEYKYRDCCNKNKQVVKDSRGSCVNVGLFGDGSYESETTICGLIPAYLVVFELE